MPEDKLIVAAEVQAQRYAASRERMAQLTERWLALELEQQARREEAEARRKEITGTKTAAEKTTHLDAAYADFLRTKHQVQAELLRAETDAASAAMAHERACIQLRLLAGEVVA